MKRQAKVLAAASLLALGLAGCDGGSSGTGITTAQGNVASAQAALRWLPRTRQPTMLARVLRRLRLETEADARAPLEDIRVAIENSSVAARTDADGRFSLRGDFAGPVAMVFELPDGGARARLVITVPRGGELTLTNVHVDGRSGRVSTDEQSVRFGGLVDETDCSQQTATVLSRLTPSDGNRYAVALGAASVRDPAGNTLGCADLRGGEVVEVDGTVGGDGRVEAESVDVEGESGSGGASRSGAGSGAGGAAGDGSDGRASESR